MRPSEPDSFSGTRQNGRLTNSCLEATADSNFLTERNWIHWFNLGAFQNTTGVANISHRPYSRRANLCTARMSRLNEPPAPPDLHIEPVTLKFGISNTGEMRVEQTLTAMIFVVLSGRRGVFLGGFNSLLSDLTCSGAFGTPSGLFKMMQVS